MADRDLWGQPLSTTAEAAEHWRDFEWRAGSRRSGQVESLRAALASDPAFAVGHARAALLGLLFGVEELDAHEHGRLAAASVTPATQPWEQSAVAATTATLQHGAWASMDQWLAHQEAFPADATGLAMTSYLLGYSTRADLREEQARRGLLCQAAVGEQAAVLAYRAMIAQELGDLDAAHQLAGRALELDPLSLAAGHPMTHVFFESGDHAGGVRWLDDWLAGTDAGSPFAGHLAWHSGLHHLALGDDETVLDRLADCGGPSTGGRLVDGVSLLWRCQLHGVVPRASDPAELGVAALARPLLSAVPSAFVGAHVALALATTGDADGLRELAHDARGFDAPGAAGIVPDLALGLAAYVDDDPARAADRLLRVEPAIGRLGGSHAQREVFDDTLIRALVRAGRRDEALVRLEARLERRESRLDAGLLDRARADNLGR